MPNQAIGRRWVISMGICLTIFHGQSSFGHQGTRPEVVPAFHRSEEVCKKASSLSELLGNQRLLVEYYHAVREDYGFDQEKFPFKTFEQFMFQVKRLAKLSPEFARRVFEPQATGIAHSVQVGSIGMVQPLDTENFMKHWQEIKTRDLKNVKSFFPQYATGRVPHEAMAFLREHDRAIEGADSEQIQKSVRELRSQPKVQAAVLAIAHWALRDLASRPPRTVEEATRAFQELRTNDLLEGIPLPRTFTWLATAWLPARAYIKERFGLEISRDDQAGLVAAGTYEWRPASRLLHTIFKGVCHNECIGGGQDFAGNLSPIRWATSIVHGAHFYGVYHAGQFKGWTQIVPIAHIRKNQIHGNFESGTFLFSHDAVDPITYRRVPFFELWLRSFAPLDHGFQELVLSQSLDADNVGTLTKIKDSWAYRLGHEQGDSDDYDYVDEEFVMWLAKNSPTKGPSENDVLSSYDGIHLAIDATSDSAGTIRSFDPTAPNWVKTPNLIAKSFKGSNKRRRLLILSQLMQVDFADPEINQFVLKKWNSLNPDEREDVLEVLSFDTQLGILRLSQLVQALLTDTSTRLKILTPHDDLWSHLERVFERNSSHVSHDFLVNLAHDMVRYDNDIATTINIQKALAKKANTAEELLASVQPFAYNPSDEYLEELDSFLTDQADRFFAMNPTLEQQRTLLELTNYTDEALIIHRKAFERAANAEEFLAMIAPSVEDPSQPYKRDLAKLLLETEIIEHFQNLNPTEEQVAEYQQYLGNSSRAKAALQSLISFSQSCTRLLLGNKKNP